MGATYGSEDHVEHHGDVERKGQIIGDLYNKEEADHDYIGPACREKRKQT